MRKFIVVLAVLLGVAGCASPRWMGSPSTPPSATSAPDMSTSPTDLTPQTGQNQPFEGEYHQGD